MPAAPAPLATTPPEASFERTRLWKLKQRLQWTGWLQYLILMVIAAVFLGLAGLGALAGVWPLLLVDLPLLIAALLVAFVAFDLATVRLGLHPAEPLPRALDNLDEFDLMRARRSCRSFQRRKMTDAHRAAVLNFARTHIRPENRIARLPIRLEYLAHPLKVWPVVGAQEFLVAVAPRDYAEAAVVDIGYALQNVGIEATRLGLATCWIGPGAEPGSVAAALGDRFDAARDHVICVCALGYASKYKPLSLRLMQKQQRWRHPLNKLFFRGGEFTDPIDPTAPPYDEFGRCYEVCQWSPSSYNAQTTRASVTLEKGHVARVDFAAISKSRYYAMVALGIWVSNSARGARALGIDGQVAFVPEDDERRKRLPRLVASWLREG